DGIAVRLEDEDVGAADALPEPAVDLAVGERREDDLAQRDPEVLGDLLAELLVAPPREEHQLLLGHELHRRLPLPVVPVASSGFAVAVGKAAAPAVSPARPVQLRARRASLP